MIRKLLGAAVVFTLFCGTVWAGENSLWTVEGGQTKQIASPGALSTGWTAQVAGTLQVDSSQGGVSSADSKGAITIGASGALEVINGSFSMTHSDATIVIEAGGKIEIKSTANYFNATRGSITGDGTIINAGTFNVNAATISSAITNTGTIAISTTTINSNITNTGGTVKIEGSSSGSPTITGTITGGDVHLSSFAPANILGQLRGTTTVTLKRYGTNYEFATALGAAGNGAVVTLNTGDATAIAGGFEVNDVVIAGDVTIGASGITSKSTDGFEFDSSLTGKKATFAGLVSGDIDAASNIVEFEDLASYTVGSGGGIAIAGGTLRTSAASLGSQSGKIVDGQGAIAIHTGTTVGGQVNFSQAALHTGTAETFSNAVTVANLILGANAGVGTGDITASQALIFSDAVEATAEIAWGDSSAPASVTFAGTYEAGTGFDVDAGKTATFNSTATGEVTVKDGGTVALGGNTGGNLDLDINEGGTLKVQASATVGDLTAVDGSTIDFGALTDAYKLTIDNSATLSLTDATLKVDITGASLTNPFELLNYASGAAAGQTVKIVAGGLGLDDRGVTIIDNTALKFEVLSGAQDLAWNGTAMGSTWSMDDTDQNWGTSGGGLTYLKAYDSVDFSDAATNKTVEVDADGVTVAKMEVTGTDYTFQFDLANGETPAITATATGGAGSVNLGSSLGTVFDIVGYTDNDDLPFTLISSDTAITGDYTIKVDGNAIPLTPDIDTYLTVAEDTSDSTKIAVDVGLVWSNDSPGSNPGQAHGTFNVANDFTVDSVLADNVSASGGNGLGGWDGTNLTKKGDGTLTLTKANTYSGGTTVEAGTLSVTNLGALGTGDATVEGDAVLEAKFDALASADMTNLAAMAARIKLDADGAFGLVVADNYTIGANLALNAAAADSTFTVDSANKTVTLADGFGIDAKSANFVVAEDTTFSIAGTSSITAAKTVFDGILDLPAASSLTVNGAAHLASTGSISLGATTADDIGAITITGAFTADAKNAGAVNTFTVAARNGNSANIFLGSRGREYIGQIFLTAGEVIADADFQNLKSNFYSLELSEDGKSVLIAAANSHAEVFENLFPSGVSANMAAGAAAFDANADFIPPGLKDGIDAYVGSLDVEGMSRRTQNIAFRQLYGEYAVYARDSVKVNMTSFTSLLKNWVDQQRYSQRFASSRTSSSDAAYASYIKQGPAHANRVWASGFGSWVEQKERNGAAGYDYGAGGIVLGYDHALHDNFILGFAGAYTRGKLDVDDLRTEYDSDIVNLGLYAAYFHDSGLYAKAGLGFTHGWNDYDVGMVLGGKKEGDFKSYALSANLEFGREWELPRNFNLIPSVGVDFAYLKNKGWSEKATGTAVANRFLAEHDTMVDIPVKARLNRIWDLGCGRYVAPEISAAWIYSASKHDSAVNVGYVGGNFNWRQSGVDAGRNKLQVGAGVKARLTERIEARIDYTFEAARKYLDHNVSAAIGLSF